MREYVNLNTKWAFSKEADCVPEVMPKRWYWVDLPHCWNAIDGQDGGSDYYRGMVTFDRKYKKDAFYAYKAWLSDEPFVHICGKRYVDRVEETTLTAEAGECWDESRIRRVEKFNEVYRLKEKGAVLNWFDITEPEGYFSLNDRIEDIISTEEGKEKFLGLIDGILSRWPQKEENDGENGPVMNDKMFKMLGSFTVLRMISMMGTAGLKPMTKEELLELNAALNQIRKQGAFYAAA